MWSSQTLKQVLVNLRPSACIVLGSIAVGSVASAAPIVEYRFDETGVSAPSVGTDITALFFTNSNGDSVDLHGAPRSGVTGTIGDRAFDNTASTGMGGAGIGGMAAHLVDDNAIDNLLSFTLSGWFKAETSSLPGNARLFKNTSGLNADRLGFHALGGNIAGEYRMATDAVEKTIAIPTPPPAETWVFLAFTYNGTQSKGNFRLYAGYRTAAESPTGIAAVKLIDDKTLDSGRAEQDSGVLQIGNENSNDFAYTRPFDGWIDNIRIDGSTVNNTGALEIGPLEARRASDVANIEIAPEPACGMIFLLSLGVLGSRRSRNAKA